MSEKLIKVLLLSHWVFTTVKNGNISKKYRKGVIVLQLPN